MADLQEQLRSILGDPQAMSQIAAIAQALTGGGAPSPALDGTGPAQPESVQDVEYVPVEPQEGPQGEATAAPPEGWREASTAQSGTGQDQGGPDLSQLLYGLGVDLDPRLLQIALRVLSEGSERDEERAALLSALRPFLRPERQAKLEKAVSIARLSRLIKVVTQLLREENGHV